MLNVNSYQCLNLELNLAPEEKPEVFFNLAWYVESWNFEEIIISMVDHNSTSMSFVVNISYRSQSV